MGQPSSLPPALFPDRERRKASRMVLLYTGRFIEKYGYWPSTEELARFMKAPVYAVHWYAMDLLKRGYIQRPAKRGNRRTYAITATGWAALDLDPIAPRAPRPGSSERKAAERRVAEQILREIEAEAIKKAFAP